MTWTRSFVSPKGEAIVDFDLSQGERVGSAKLEYDQDERVAVDAADMLCPNSEDGEQAVNLTGYRGDAGQCSVTVSVRPSAA